MTEAEIAWLMDPGAPDLELFLAELVQRPSFHAKAACRGMGPALFFLSRRDGHGSEAKAICSGCGVRSECLDAALAMDDCRGIWTGLSERGRRELRRGSAMA